MSEPRTFPGPEANDPQPTNGAQPDAVVPVPVPAGRNRLVIGLLLCAAFVVILNETIMSVALPSLMADLHIEARTAQWVTTGFLLTMAVVIPITGFIQQRFTTRQVFIGAMVTFSLGTLVCAIAPGFGILLLGRVIQACGTAVMMPLLMTTILMLIPMERRGQVMGTVSIVMSVAPALGPTISGIILQFLSWRWMFLLVLPIALIMVGIGAAKMVNVSETRRVPVDAVSIVLSVIGFGGLVYALNQIGESSGNGPLVLIVSAVAATLGLAGFVFRQLALQRRDAPLLDLRVFTSRNFSLSVGVLMIAFAALLGSALLWPLYLQQVRGLSTLTTGLLLLPGGLSMGLMGPLVGRLYDKVGPRPLTIPAAVVMSIMLLGMSTADVDTSLPVLLGLHVGLSLALGFMFTPMFTHGLNSLEPARYAFGSAALGTLQQIAGAAGTALLVTIMANRAAQAMAGGADPIAGQHVGLQTSFIVSAVLVLTTVALSVLIRPTERSGGAPIGH